MNNTLQWLIYGYRIPYGSPNPFCKSHLPVYTIVRKGGRAAWLSSDTSLTCCFQAPVHTIVLCNGLSVPTGPLPIDWFRGIPAALREYGCNVFVAPVPPTEGIPQKAEALRWEITRHFKSLSAGVQKPKVHLIGMSMGGLDCRYLASIPDLEFEVMSVTTVGTHIEEAV
ncbi:hypothetical protein PILCRDRAFT_500421 [Piloderma croceum F 1598]|uniref:GPI inositol-deacylase n=1 Tax=Piloderma croceum (strain F 1598) TaxID=765440 RepID=A0A0C3B576_PILCF|nr:hypothetical protein PILCRDRAFT_500421 [Piloderma croceum F 1598]